MPKRPKSIAELPATVPLFPVSGALLFPRLQSPLQVFEDRYIKLVDDILGANRLIALIQPKDTKEESPEGKDAELNQVGTIGYLAHFEEFADSRYLIGLEGVCRFEVGEEMRQKNLIALPTSTQVALPLTLIRTIRKNQSTANGLSQ